MRIFIRNFYYIGCFQHKYMFMNFEKNNKLIYISEINNRTK